MQKDKATTTTRKAKKSLYTEQIVVTFTPKQKAILQKYAEQHGLSLSSLIRFKVLEDMFKKIEGEDWVKVSPYKNLENLEEDFYDQIEQVYNSRQNNYPQKNNLSITLQLPQNLPKSQNPLKS